MKKNIVIVGPAASGKDTLRKRFEKKGFTYCKPYTTRPKRTGESDYDYVFINEAEFEGDKDCGRFAVTGEYNNWKYGITKTDLKTSNLFILTPDYLQQMGDDFISDSFIIYLNPDVDTRIDRLCRRHDADNVVRRVDADSEQFSDFTLFDLEITNPNF